MQINPDELSVVAIVDNLIKTAISQRVSDIHLEPQQNRLRVRYRIDGLLYEQEPLPEVIKLNVISRIKVMSSIDIAEQRLPQDGMCVVLYNERAVEIRVSTFPSLYGEKVVLRILDKHQMQIDIEQLGFSAQMLDSFKRILGQKQGFFLVTGPTGSGKTTTLYAALTHLNKSITNIVTLEDPIEYHVDSVTQAQVRPAIGFTFARGMRSVLRQDPDVIMIGEIRDAESAHTAIEASLTGHLVLSTLHTNDAPSAVTRLVDMGIEPFLLNASLTGVLAQRLVRKICGSCQQPYELSAEEREMVHSTNEFHAVVGGGCVRCDDSGYHGRVGVFELLTVNEPVRERIAQSPSKDQLSQLCRDHGMQTLWSDALSKVIAGQTSLPEILPLRCLE